jgi:hypothetical protein
MGRTVAERGQASAEVLAGIPALILAALIALQLLAVGYAASLADGAVEAGAMAMAAGTDPAEAVRAALPGWAEGRVDTRVSDGGIEVSLRPLALADALADRLEVSASGWVRPAF